MLRQLIVLSLCLLFVHSNMMRRKLEALERDVEMRILEEEALEEERGVAARHRRQEESMALQGCSQGDLVFILDSSGSIGMTNWQYVREFISDVVDRVGVGPDATHVGVVVFGDAADIVFNLNTYTEKASMKAAIEQIPFLDQNTNTSGGIYKAHRIMFTKANGDREMAPNFGIVVTDGVSTYDNDKTIPYANQAKQAGITMVSVGVGDKTSPEELSGMASIGRDGKPLVFQVGSYDMLNMVKEKLAHVACDIPTDNEEIPGCDTTEIECIGLACKNKCKFGFQADKNWCQTCACKAEPPLCP